MAISLGRGLLKVGRNMFASFLSFRAGGSLPVSVAKKSLISNAVLSGVMMLGGLSLLAPEHTFVASALAQEKKGEPQDLVKQSEAPGLSDRDRSKQRESLEKELSSAFKKWLNEDVGYIITDEERKVFTQ